MSILKKVLTKLQEDQLWEMANFRPKSTGLSVNIYISTGEVEGKKMKHGPRIKVSRTYSENFTPFDSFSITISSNPSIEGDIGEIKQKDMKKIFSFIKQNKETLLAYWDGDLDTADLIYSIEKV